nr:peptidase dimerization domain-containing protein [Endozoicomonas sp.]
MILGYQGAGEISIGARGILRLWINIHGKAAHPGSRSRQGVNAINLMAQVLSALGQTHLANHTEPYFPFGSQLQPTLIKGGDALNRVPDQCSAFIDIRLLPSMEKGDVVDQLTSVIERVMAETPDGHYSIELLEWLCSHGWLLSPGLWPALVSFVLMILSFQWKDRYQDKLTDI